MPIEAELKAHVRDRDTVHARLLARGDEEVSVYADTYYDRPDGSILAADEELRVRTKTTDRGESSLLTYKQAAVHESGSKPEHETPIARPDAVHAMLHGLGFRPALAFEKQCRNVAFDAHGRRMMASVVYVPEIGTDFLEVETMVDDTDEVDAALIDVRRVMLELGIGPDDFTTELYTDAVRRARSPRR